MAVHTFLAHRIAADELMVNGYDLIALDEGILNLLKDKGTFKYGDIDAIVERAKVARPLRMKPPQASQPPTSQGPKP